MNYKAKYYNESTIKGAEILNIAIIHIGNTLTTRATNSPNSKLKIQGKVLKLTTKYLASKLAKSNPSSLDINNWRKNEGLFIRLLFADRLNWHGISHNGWG